MSTTNRETKEIKIGEHTVVVNTYLTGREVRDIENALIDKLEMKQTPSGQEISGIKGSVLKEREDNQIKAVVVSMDGSADNLLNRLLDLPAGQYDEVMVYVKTLTEKKEVATNSKR